MMSGPARAPGRPIGEPLSGVRRAGGGAARLRVSLNHAVRKGRSAPRYNMILRAIAGVMASCDHTSLPLCPGVEM
eukprot:659712-Hanusia_phi.AAC.1